MDFGRRESAAEFLTQIAAVGAVGVFFVSVPPQRLLSEGVAFLRIDVGVAELARKANVHVVPKAQRVAQGAVKIKNNGFFAAQKITCVNHGLMNL